MLWIAEKRVARGGKLILTSPRLEINNRIIGPGERPYVVAELSANHNGSLDTALRCVESAKRSGASAVKIQTFRPDTITLNSNREEFTIKSGPWAGKTLYELYSEAHTPWEWHASLFEQAKNCGITIFSTPFDHSAVDFLEKLGAPAYKIASFELVDLSLIRYAASTKKPLILSTGMADLDEIIMAVDAARSAGCHQLGILHCVSGYPAPPADYNLASIRDMKARFDAVIGLSDHTLGSTTALAGVAIGASIIEKHFTLDRSQGGLDDSFSLEPNEFSYLCREVEMVWQSIGTVTYGCKQSEEGNKALRRSLYFVKSLKAGDLITPDAVRSIRPGMGLAPKYLNNIIGKRLRNAVDLNTPVRMLDIDLH